MNKLLFLLTITCVFYNAFGMENKNAYSALNTAFYGKDSCVKDSEKDVSRKIHVSSKSPLMLSRSISEDADILKKTQDEGGMVNLLQHEDINHSNILHARAMNSLNFDEIISNLEQNNLLKKLINKQDNHGNTSLHTACFKGQVDVVKSLINKGANPRLINSKMIVPALYAMIGEFSGRNKENKGVDYANIINYLYDNSGFVTVPSACVLTCAAKNFHWNKDYVQKQLRRMPMNDKQMKNYLTNPHKKGLAPLEVALRKGRSDLAEMYLVMGAKPCMVALEDYPSVFHCLKSSTAYDKYPQLKKLAEKKENMHVSKPSYSPLKKYNEKKRVRFASSVKKD